MEQTQMLITVAATVIQLLGFLGGLYFFSKRFPLERLEKRADAENDLSEAALKTQQAVSAQIANYDSLFRLVQSRDAEMQELKRESAKQILELETKVIGLTAQHRQQGTHIDDLERRLRTSEQALAEEKTKREKLQSDLDDQILQRIGLQKERDELREELNTLKLEYSQLRTEFDQLKQKEIA